MSEQPQPAANVLAYPVQMLPTWQAPADDLGVEFVNQIALQVVNGEILITFGQALPPIFSTDTQEQAEEARDTKIRPVARFVVAPEIFRQMAQSMQSASEFVDSLAGQASH